MDNLEICNSVSLSPRTSRSLQEGHGRILSKFTDHERVGPAIKQNPERDSTRGCTSACQATRELSASKSQNSIPTAVMLRTNFAKRRSSQSKHPYPPGGVCAGSLVLQGLKKTERHGSAAAIGMLRLRSDDRCAIVTAPLSMTRFLGLLVVAKKTRPRRNQLT